ncbi:MAG: hypothetical protein EB057_04435 [Microbacteriaceae bacterium]|nr:hypothetical protein [Microbacteriaceae bacterium]
MNYIEEQKQEARNQAITQRIAYLELSMKKAFSHIETLAHSLATRGGGSFIEGGACIGGGGSTKDNKPKVVGFITIAEQASKYLQSRLTPEQIKLLRSTRRDEDTTLLRRNVICDLYAKGVSANMIGRILNKDHNTIFYNLVMGKKLKVGNNKQYKARMKSKSLIKLGRTKKSFLDNF